MPAPKHLVSTAEAAEILGVSERRVRQLAVFLHADRDEMGRLWFNRAAVQEHAATRGTTRRHDALTLRVATLETDLASLRAVVRQHGADLHDILDALRGCDCAGFLAETPLQLNTHSTGLPPHVPHSQADTQPPNI